MTWWRNLSGLLAACVLTLVVIAPTLSMATCLCRGETPIVSVETSAATAQTVQGEQRDHDAPCDAACCVSGHCHHGGAMLDAAIPPVPGPAPVASEHAIAFAHALSSRTISGPDRPPRG
jgi:hypothetical protein